MNATQGTRTISRESILDMLPQLADTAQYDRAFTYWLQALLLDNQAEAADYGQATLAEILRRYVTPYGVGLEKAVSLPAVQGFSVASGSSCWKK